MDKYTVFSEEYIEKEVLDHPENIYFEGLWYERLMILLEASNREPLGE